MKQVRILKDGVYNGFIYIKGEIYPFIRKSDIYAYIGTSKKNTLVAVEENSLYGIEAEIIEIPEHNLNLVL